MRTFILNGRQEQTDQEYLTRQELVDMSFGKGVHDEKHATIFDFEAFGSKGHLLRGQKLYISPDLIVWVSFSTPGKR